MNDYKHIADAFQTAFVQVVEGHEPKLVLPTVPRNLNFHQYTKGPVASLTGYAILTPPFANAAESKEAAAAVKEALGAKLGSGVEVTSWKAASTRKLASDPAWKVSYC